jgi:hypothetical protein
MYTSASTRFLTDVFGISPVNIDGTARSLGTYLPIKHSAVFWQMRVSCIKSDVISVHSDYHVTLIEIQNWRFNKTYTFVIHPVPIEELRECRMAIMPQWSVTIDGHDVELTGLCGGDQHGENILTWYGANITVVLDGWIPDYGFIGRY